MEVFVDDFLGIIYCMAEMFEGVFEFIIEVFNEDFVLIRF